MNPISKTILVVDDSLDNIQMMSEVLEYLGCEVLIATTGNQALDIARRALPTAIFLDVTMPQMNGFDVCRALKNGPTTAPIPVFFLSGHDGPEVRTLGQGAGAEGFLVKPILVEEIRAILANLH